VASTDAVFCNVYLFQQSQCNLLKREMQFQNTNFRGRNEHMFNTAYVGEDGKVASRSTLLRNTALRKTTRLHFQSLEYDTTLKRVETLMSPVRVRTFSSNQ
jgi:hypothetical protein